MPIRRCLIVSDSFHAADGTRKPAERRRREIEGGGGKRFFRASRAVLLRACGCWE